LKCNFEVVRFDHFTIQFVQTGSKITVPVKVGLRQNCGMYITS